MINNLRFRFIVVFVSLAIGPLLIVGVVVNQLNFNTLERQSLVSQKKIAESVGTEIRAFVESKSHELILLDKVHRLGTLPSNEQYLLLNKMLFLEHMATG